MMVGFVGGLLVGWFLGMWTFYFWLEWRARKYGPQVVMTRDQAESIKGKYGVVGD